MGRYKSVPSKRSFDEGQRVRSVPFILKRERILPLVRYAQLLAHRKKLVAPA